MKLPRKSLHENPLINYHILMILFQTILYKAVYMYLNTGVIKISYLSRWKCVSNISLDDYWYKKPCLTKYLKNIDQYTR